MIQALAILLGLVGIAAVTTAIYSAVKALSLVPKEQRGKALRSIRLMQFQNVRTVAGPEADRHLRRYGLAFATMFIVIFFGMLLGIYANITSRPLQTALISPPLALPQVIASET